MTSNKSYRIPLLKPPNSQGPLESQGDPAAFQQAPTACQTEKLSLKVYMNFMDLRVKRCSNFQTLQ